MDRAGELTKPEKIPSGRSVRLTVEERKMNQELAYSPESDIFANGTLTLIDGASAAQEFASNPNMLSEPDMRGIIKGRSDTFANKVSEISNMTTLQRLLTLAKEADVAISKVEAIQNRINEIEPKFDAPVGSIKAAAL